MNIDITVDSRELKAAFSKAPERVNKGIDNWIDRTAAMSEREGKKEVPVKQGLLQNSIRITKGKMFARVEPHKEYALAVHEGTGIYGPKKRPIVARGRAFPIQTSGGLIFRRSIKGQKPNPFMDRAYDIVKPRAEREGQQVLDEIVRSI